MKTVSRRDLLRMIGIGGAAVTAAACQPKVVEVEKVVTQVVEKVVKETVMVAGTPQVVEKVVKQTVVVEKEVEKVVEKVIEVEKEIELRWVTNHGAAEMPNFQRVVDNFEEKYPNMKVDFLNMPGGNEYYNAMNTQGVGGDLPDVFYCRSMDTAPWASRGWLVNLEPFIDVYNIDKADFWEAQIPQLSFRDDLYALPYDFSCMGFFYNKDILDEAGVDYPPADWTWEDWANYCEQLVITKDGKTERWATTFSIGNWTFRGILQCNGGGYWTEDDRTCTMASDSNVEFIEWLISARDRGVFPEGGVLPQGVNPWISGLTVMQYNGSWATQGLREQVGDKFDWDVSPMPFGSEGRRGVSAAGGAWSIGFNTKQINEAFLLCDHVSSTESCNILISEPVRSIPARKSSVPLWVERATSAGLPPANVQAFADEIGDAYARPYPAFWKDFEVVYNNRMPPLVYGGGDEEADVRETLEIMQDEIQDAMDMWWSQA